MTHSELLDKVYDDAIKLAFDEKVVFDKIDSETREYVECIVLNSEKNKSVLAVLTTLLVHKIIAPGQDIRFHQAELKDGFSGRGIDKSFVTPFMKMVAFPANAESGWLTRSFEQKHPFTLNFPGSIRPKATKEAFLNIIDSIQTKGASSQDILLHMFVLLIRKRDSMKVELAKPHSLPISTIINLLERHFTAKYASAGASRLPTLAVYAAYQSMMGQVARYEGKILCQLENHTSSDSQSGRIGDIDVNNPDDTAFEGIEIKHEIKITKGLITNAYEKFKIHNTERYYLLTTANMDKADWTGINEEIVRIAQIHGCQVIVNGVYDSLKYYLRLLADPAEFIDRYVDLMKIDESIKFQHKTMWNDVVAGGY